MTIQQLLLVLRARWYVVLLTLFATVAGTITVSLLVTKQYTARTALVVDIRSPDPISAMMLPNNMATQEEIIKSERVARKVVRLLKLDENSIVQDNWREATSGRGSIEVWIAELLQTKLAVIPPRRESTVLMIEYTAADPGFAAAVANGFAQAYVDAILELKVEPAKQYARWFAEQGKGLRENLEKAQERLSAFQQERGIVAKDESVDTETARLAALTQQLVAVQAQTSDARSKQRSASDSLPEVMQNPVVAGLRSDIGRHEARLKEVGVNLGRNHPQVRRMESELAALRMKLEAETKHVASSFAASGTVNRDRERELSAAIEAQKNKLLALMRDRDQLAVLQRDVDWAKNAYDAVARRYHQTSLESQASQTNVFQLTPASAPLEPSSPKVVKYAVMALLFGVGLGIGIALLLEMLDRRVRSGEDLAAMLQLPVLALIPRMEPQRRRVSRLVFWRREPALPAP